MALDDFDRALMAATQGGLPLVPRPYDAVGQQLGVSGQQVRELLGTACRGHDILYSTAILKKTGLRLRQSQES